MNLCPVAWPARHQERLAAELEHLATFFRRLNDMASKGVHGPVNLAESKQGLVGLLLLPHCSSKRTEADFQAPRPPRSPDRTRSPVAVSQKREYFKYPPETIGDFASAAANLGARRPIANSQKPAIGGHF